MGEQLDNILCHALQETTGVNDQEVQLTTFAFGQEFPWIGVWRCANGIGAWTAGQWAEDGTASNVHTPTLSWAPSASDVLDMLEENHDAIILGSLPK